MRRFSRRKEVANVRRVYIYNPGLLTLNEYLSFLRWRSGMIRSFGARLPCFQRQSFFTILRISSPPAPDHLLPLVSMRCSPGSSPVAFPPRPSFFGGRNKILAITRACSGWRGAGVTGAWWGLGTGVSWCSGPAAASLTAVLSASASPKPDSR